MTLIIGIDISKKSSDWCVLTEAKTSETFKVGNNAEAMKSAINRVAKKFSIDKSELLLCAEYTGKYIYPLTVACADEGVFLWMENAYNIHLYAQKARGKNDSVDAFRIADYARKNQDDAKAYVMPSPIMAELHQLLSIQQDLDEQAAKYTAKINDCKGYYPEEVYKSSCKYWQAMKDTAVQQSAAIERKVKKLIASDPVLKHQDELLRTIPGVGEKVSHSVIVATQGFREFDNARKFCCQAGVAPFGYTSGTSVRSGNHVSRRANMRLKRNIHIAAHIAANISKSGPIKEYYLRKLAEGKNKMSVLNACRAKLITIMYAVIRDDNPFDPNYIHK